MGMHTIIRIIATASAILLSTFLFLVFSFITSFPKISIINNYSIENAFFEEYIFCLQTYKYFDESARKNVQELINYFSLYNLESLSYEYLKKFIKEKFS